MGTVQVHVRGPIADGRAHTIIDEFLAEAVDEVAQQGLADVQLLLDVSIRHPTPYYETQIRIDRAGADRVVDDRDVIYGPWLEGVGERNRTTRFKGYAAFRRATQQLNRQAPDLVEDVLRRRGYLRALGGE